MIYNIETLTYTEYFGKFDDFAETMSDRVTSSQ